jgi:hypothetical protein
MMESEERGVSICFKNLRACARKFLTLNEIALPIVPTGTIRFTLTGQIVIYDFISNRCGAAGETRGASSIVSGDGSGVTGSTPTVTGMKPVSPSGTAYAMYKVRRC